MVRRQPGANRSQHKYEYQYEYKYQYEPLLDVWLLGLPSIENTRMPKN